MDIPFLCPQCEWNGNEPLDLDIFDDLDINIDPNIAVDTKTVLEPLSTVGL